MDETICRKKLTSYSCYTLRKATPIYPSDKLTWARSEVVEQKLRPGKIQAQVKKLSEARGKIVSVTEKKAALAPFQQGQINKLLDQLADHEPDPNFAWTLVEVDKQERDLGNGKRETTVMTAYFKRAPLEHLSAIELNENIEKNRARMAEDRMQAERTRAGFGTDIPSTQTRTESGHVSSSRISSTQTQTSASSKLDNTTENTEFSNEKSDCVAPIPLMEEPRVQNRGLYTARTTYSASETSTLPPPRDKGFISDLAAELFKIVAPESNELVTLNRISDILPESLRAFALKGKIRTSYLMRMIQTFLLLNGSLY
jgi:hypothetical protein